MKKTRFFIFITKEVYFPSPFQDPKDAMKDGFIDIVMFSSILIPPSRANRTDGER